MIKINLIRSKSWIQRLFSFDTFSEFVGAVSRPDTPRFKMIYWTTNAPKRNDEQRGFYFIPSIRRNDLYWWIDLDCEKTRLWHEHRKKDSRKKI